MGWEKRGNGRYYYRKIRRDGRVYSEYIGKGDLAQIIAQLDHHTQLEREIERMERVEELRAQETDRALERRIDAVGDTVRQLTAAVLLTSSHYAHRGQWRKRRDAQSV